MTQTGRHVIETSGQTDVVMKLFGPNSQTSLAAEDDDGGVGLNSRIAARLIPGQYFVQSGISIRLVAPVRTASV